MAIARDAATSKDLAASPSTQSHTCAAGASLVIGTYAGNTYASGVTYNGVAMTRIKDVISDVGEYSLTLWFLANPASGSNTISASVASGNVGFWAQSYTGVAGGAGISTTNTGSGSSLTTTLTPLNNANDWVVGMFGSSANTLAAGTGTNFNFSPLHNTCLGDSNGTAGSTSYSMQTTAGSGTFAAALLDLKSVGAAIANSGFFFAVAD